MIVTVTISLWAHLFCGPWSEPGKVFGWLRRVITDKSPYWIAHPLIECGMCHAVWVALIYQSVNLYNGGRIDSANLLSILSASFLAHLLDEFATIREKWKHH